MPALSVLVVACPCPLILATPSAVLAAMSWLARRGVIIKGSEVLERLAKVNTLALDKTGTVTRGELRVLRIRPLEGLEEAELLRIAASAERRSEHLIGRVLVREAEGRQQVLPVPVETQVLPGQGILSEFKGNPFGIGDEGQTTRVVVGSASWIQSRGIAWSQELSEALSEADSAGETPLVVALNGRCLGLIGVRDEIREGASSIIQQLKQEGLGDATLLTGDRVGVAGQVAKELGLGNRYQAELLPTEKGEWIEEKQRGGARVLMVGDGINDAPALAMASVGIALGGVGSQIAAEAGDVILMGDPLAPLPGLVRISRTVVENIRQSILWFAFGMNGLGMLLSAVGWLNPVGAALFHEGASLAVMFNALRLLWFEGWEETKIGRSVGDLMRGVETLFEFLSPTRIVGGVVRNMGLLTQLGVSLGIVAWGLSNLVILREGEQGLVTRFGRQEALLGAGLHLRWPYPLERIYREKTGLIRTVQLGFRGTGDGDTQGKTVPPIEWQAEHRGTKYQSVAAEAQMLGGEEVPLEVTSELQYRISDLESYLFVGGKPEEILRSSLERVLRELISTRRLEDLLTSGRVDLERSGLEVLQRHLESLSLGVELLDLTLLDVHPPIAVIPDYRKVGDALEYREELINEGQRTYVRDLMLAVGESGLKILTGGEARPGSKSLGIESDWKLTETVWKMLTTPQEGTNEEGLGGTAEDLLLTARGTRTQLTEEAQGEADSFAKMAAVHQISPALTVTQILWEFRERMLSGTGLTLLDPHAKGRRQWLLGPAAISRGELERVMGATTPEGSEAETFPSKAAPENPLPTETTTPP